MGQLDRPTSATGGSRRAIPDGGAGRKAYSDVARLLLTRIREEEMTPGTRLPAERQLAEEFGVSRPTIREALAALGVTGVLETRVGSGTFVTASGAEAEPGYLGASPYDILDGRLLVEPRLARLAAQRRDRPALLIIERALRDSEAEAEAGSEEVPTESDRSFHLAITRASDNEVLLRVAMPLWDAMSQTLWRRFKEQTWNAEQTRRVAIEHRQIYEPIRDRDPDRAEFEMESHIRRVQRDLFEASEILEPPTGAGSPTLDSVSRQQSLRPT